MGGGSGYPQDNPHGHGEMWSVGLEDHTLLQSGDTKAVVSNDKPDCCTKHEAQPNFLFSRL